MILGKENEWDADERRFTEFYFVLIKKMI